MVSYTKEKTITDLENVLDSRTINELYNDPIFQRSGTCKNTDIPYTEEIIEYLIANKIISDNEIKNVKKITRERRSYYSKSHESLLKNISEGSNREEENYVKSLFFYNPAEIKEKIGAPIDYQIPLKNSAEDKKDKIGKAFDLLTYKKETNELFIVEVKRKGSDETALRCCLEVQTYYQNIDKEKLKKDYKEIGKINDVNNTNVKRAVIVFEDSTAGREFRAAESGDKNRKRLNDLVKDFDITVCYAK